MSAKRKQPAKKAAKRTPVTAAVFERICTRLAEGESLLQITKDPKMPAYSTVRKAIVESESLAEKYARARTAQAEHYAAEIIQIADTTDDPNKARLQIDARKWYASKLAPKNFGERLDVEHAGSVAVQVTIGGDSA